MKLELSDEQHEKMLKLVYLGMWVAESVGNENQNHFEELEQMIFEKSKGSDLEEFIEYDEETKKYLPTSRFDEDKLITTIINEYEERVFWDELIDRLTKRDLLKKYGIEKILKMDFKERYNLEKIIMDKYELEFSKHALENIKIKNIE